MLFVRSVLCLLSRITVLPMPCLISKSLWADYFSTHFSYENHTVNPSLTSNARRRGFSSFFIQNGYPQPLPRLKRETEGFSLFFDVGTSCPTPPSFQTQVGRVTLPKLPFYMLFCLYIWIIKSFIA